MRRKIVQRTRKALFQAGLYSLLLSLLSIPASGWAAEWTREFSKVMGAWTNVHGFNVYLDPQSADNVNNCASYLRSISSGGGEQNVAIFVMLYPAIDTPTEAQKVMISQILTAAATGKPIRILSSACNGTTANNIDGVWLKAD